MRKSSTISRWSRTRQGVKNKIMIPQYDLEKIKFGTDGPTFERAVDLYESGKITEFKIFMNGFSA